MKRPVTLLRLTCYAALGAFSAHSAYADVPSWNAQAAGKYLEERRQAWMEFTTKKAWQHKQPQTVACMSCHTVLPALLAEPALDRTLGVDVPSPFAVVFTDRMRDKVMRPDAAQNARTGYLNSAEPIVYALALALDDRQQGRKALSAETEEAFRHMWSEQIRTGAAKGSWAWPDTQLDPWETPDSVYYGASLAALAVGFAPADYRTRPDIQTQIAEMKEYIRAGFHAQIMHHRLAALWASGYLPDLVSASDRETTANEISRLQNADGGWSWSAIGPWKPRADSYVAAVATSIDSDGYATAYTACALKESGIPILSLSLQHSLQWLASHQDSTTGGWDAKSVNGLYPKDSVLGHLMGDAASGYAILALSKTGD